MSRYPFERVTQNEEVITKIDDSTVKTICSTIQVPPYIEVLSASLNIIDITETSGQPLAQVEIRELGTKQREDPILGKWVRATINRRHYLTRNQFL